LFSAGGIFSNELGGSGVNSVPTNHREVNGIEFVEFSNPNTGVVDVVMTGVSDSDFVGYYRLYENGKPTNKWSSKFENQSRNKDNFKTMISGVQEMLPQGHEYTEKTSISTDGLRVWNQQLSKGYELQYDNNGNLITNTVTINGDAIVNELGIDVNQGNFDNISVTSKGQFESVKKALLPYLQKFGLNESNIRNVNGTVEIDLPILKNNKIQQGESHATTSNQSETEAKKADIERRRQEELNIYNNLQEKLEVKYPTYFKKGLTKQQFQSEANGVLDINVIKSEDLDLVRVTANPNLLQQRIDKINAKYDAELKALEQQSTSTTQSEIELKNEGKAEAPTKESVTERLNINNPFYRKVEDALVKLGLIEKYNPETGTGDVVGGYAQQTSDGGFSVGKMIFSQDGSISYFDGDVKVSFDKNGNVISENTKEAKQKAVSLEIESKKESIANLEKTRDSEAFKYKEVTETDVLGNKKKVKRLKTTQELKESTDKINDAIDKAKARLVALEKSVAPEVVEPNVSLTNERNNIESGENIGIEPTEKVVSEEGGLSGVVKPTPKKVKVLGKDVNMYNDYIPSKVEDVETDAMYSFNADSKDGIPTLLHDKAYTNTREVNGVKTENWHASISGEELLKLYPKEQSLKETPKEVKS
jgi:hypothetical protein